MPEPTELKLGLLAVSLVFLGVAAGCIVAVTGAPLVGLLVGLVLIVHGLGCGIVAACRAQQTLDSINPWKC